MEKKLTKLDALRILSNAYWYVADIHNYSNGVLYDRFNYLRRSTNMVDLKPAPKCAEGFNPKGPRYL